jgi:hypothetical protein
VTRTTIKSRHAARNELARVSRVWLSLSDADLLAEVQKVFPAVTEATREECIRTLFLNFCDTHLY